MKPNMHPIITVFFLLFPFMLLGQDDKDTHWSKQLKRFKIEPIINWQLWNSYSFGAEIYNENNGAYERVDSRWNAQLRRSRFGVKGQPYKNLKFNMTAALDLVGKDLLSGTQGGGNNGASPSFRIWNAYLEWKVMDANDALHLTIGYMAPQFSRESITSAFRVSSMEKSWSQNYLRRQLIGTGPGRAAGANIGGLFVNAAAKFGWSYDLGIFNPAFHAENGNSAGDKFFPLLAGRTALYIGDPESKNYRLSHKTNYMGKRKGLSLALSGAFQGETDLFKSQAAWGFDWLLNWDQLNFDGEWTFMSKTGPQIEPDQIASFKVPSNTGYLRISYNLNLSKGRILEPVFMLMQFNGALDAKTQADAQLVNAFAGQDYSYDIGFNYYLNPDLKISLHYTFRDADAGAAEDGTTVNNYFYQAGVGALHRGDWIGLGVVAML